MRVYSFDSCMLLLHGAPGTGIFQPDSSTPVLQPNNERGQGFPQIVSLLPESADPQAFQSLQVAAFHVEQSGGANFEDLQIEAFQVENKEQQAFESLQVAAFHAEQSGGSNFEDLQIEAFQVESNDPPGEPQPERSLDWDGD